MKQQHHILTNMIAQLDEVAKIEKRDNPNDRPRVRQCINDTLDMLIRELDFHVMKETITEKKAEQFKNWLTNFAISKHP